jgi:ribulose 1,5-bisphosphate synthetase/thiazole synthase
MSNMVTWTAPLIIWLAFALVLVSDHSFATHAVAINDISQLRSEFDYVIIGGGTSGLTVANRLTEDPASEYLFERPNRRLG